MRSEESNPLPYADSVFIASQPFTFALTVPSALSIYSLGFTIHRSDFEWNAASTALFLGIVSWLFLTLTRPRVPRAESAA